MATVNASTLRANIYRLLDQVIDTGVPLEIERRGKRLRVVPAQSPPKLARLPKRPCMTTDPEALVHLDWSKEWRGDLP